MREAIFIKRNADKWKQIEVFISSRAEENPDNLAKLYIQLVDDLSYARTFYPRSKVHEYLNTLAVTIHQKIYKNKKEDTFSILRFWRHDFPLLIYQHKKQMLISLFIFAVAVFIGVLSAAHDDRFVRLILGDAYVEMTEVNIANNDPMAVYKKMNGMDMFLGITVNNIRVSFIVFVGGLFLAFGTGYLLFFNGIMLGAFEYFFFQHNLLARSLLTVSIHGIIEITSIVIAGGAGLVLGKSLLLPGTYSRKHAFVI